MCIRDRVEHRKLACRSPLRRRDFFGGGGEWSLSGKVEYAATSVQCNVSGRLKMVFMLLP
eukprot:6494598-Prymnesium_polylepis.1